MFGSAFVQEAAKNLVFACKSCKCSNSRRTTKKSPYNFVKTLRMDESISLEFNYEELISVKNFNKICRICLLEIECSPIVKLTFKDKLISDLLSTHLIIKVNLDDCLPQNICGSCSKQILDMCRLIEKCQKSDVLLRSSLKNLQVEDLVEKIKKEDTVNSNNLSYQEEEYSDKEIDQNRSKKLEIRKHKCPTCLKSFTSSKLRQHMRVHTKEKPFKCQVCFKAFSMSGNLKRHVMTHTGERPHTCEFCGKGFIQAVTLAIHKKTHVMHGKVDIVVGAPNFTCSHCGRGFKRVSSYNTHIRKHARNQNETPNDDIKKCEDTSFEILNGEIYKCSICSKSYKTKHLLKSHQLYHGEKTFLCNECGKGFITKAALQSHLKVHTGEKPHNCNICYKSFAHITSFESHLLIHTGIKPYVCSACGRAFTQLTHLKYHMRTHSGERPYQCSYCNKRFALKGNLTVHVRTHTGETPYVCSVCNKGFYDSSSMKKHKKGHTNHQSQSASYGIIIKSDDKEFVETDDTNVNVVVH